MLVIAFLIALPLGAQENLPPGPAVPLMLKACVQCHDFQWIASQRKSEAAWRRTVSEMIWRGAPLQPGESDVLTKYLATELGGDRPAVASKHEAPQTDPYAARLPQGAGRALVIAACVQCHDLGLTVNQRKSPAEWRQSVDIMKPMADRVAARLKPAAADSRTKSRREISRRR